MITPEYLALQREMHSRPRGYGGGGWKHAVELARLAGSLQARSILDYGCGQGTLKTAFASSPINVYEYDPAIPGKDARPTAPADIVVCTDVMEHVEPQFIDAVLADIRALTRTLSYICIATRPANKFLADGRNAHLTVRDGDWWSKRVTAAGRYGSMVTEGDAKTVLFKVYR